MAGHTGAIFPNRLAVLFLLVTTASLTAESSRDHPALRLPSERRDRDRRGVDDVVAGGTRWAVLIAGSSGFGNYRHQADVCHAYQIMKNGGLKDENIIVFMYDDIAGHPENPRHGVIINHPQGSDVYAGVPKDYVGDAVTVDNFFAVLLGNRTAVKGGSGKVVDSGPNDHIFVFYSDHGGVGVLGMPTYPYLYADDLIRVLKQKHAAGTYESIVFYLEACESGSIFEGLLPDDIGVYATTASNAEESSWGTYCPGMFPSPPPEFTTCLGDLYSVAWMEDSDVHNLRTESLRQQYQLVRDRTAVGNTYNYGSHVMKYGDLELDAEQLFLYIGSNPANENATFDADDLTQLSVSGHVGQRDADLVYFWQKYLRSTEGSAEKKRAHRELLQVLAHRLHIDGSMEIVADLIFDVERGPEMMSSARRPGQPAVDDWECLKSMVRAFEAKCGSLAQYGMKHMRSFANFCNAGVEPERMATAAGQACRTLPTNPWSSLRRGFSA